MQKENGMETFLLSSFWEHLRELLKNSTAVNFLRNEGRIPTTNQAGFFSKSRFTFVTNSIICFVSEQIPGFPDHVDTL